MEPKPNQDEEPWSTPKLTFHSLPPKPREPPGMLTPPFHAAASIPFIWEEAPGVPRNTISKSTSARSLDLPPRLLSELKLTNSPSPTTVLDGPYVGRSASCVAFHDIARSSSFDNISPERREFGGGGLGHKEKKTLVGFWRRGRKNNRERRGGSEANIVLPPASPCSSSSSPSSTVSAFTVGDANGEPKVKITRFTRKKSFLTISSTTNHFWASVYGSFKLVVPWRSRKKKKDAAVI